MLTKLGSLCKNGHDYQGTGQSLRILRPNGNFRDCVVCHRLKALNWNLIHREEENERLRLFAINNPEKRKATQSKYQKNNKEKENLKSSRYRARKNEAVTIPFRNTEWLLKCRNQFNWRCAYCDCQLNPDLVTLDHIIPRSLKGEESLRNFVPACDNCNKSKGNSNPVMWCQEKLGYVPFWLVDLMHTDWFSSAYFEAFKK